MISMKGHSASLARDISITLAITLSVILMVSFFEKPLTYNNGLGWDGVLYYRVAQQIHNGEKIINEAPFVYRVGIPFLAAKLFPKNILLGFRIVNLAGSILAIIFLLIFLRRYISNWAIRMLLMGLFITHWLGPLRTALFYPTQIEPASIAISLLAFVLITSFEEDPSPWKVIALATTAILGTLIRESFLLIPLIYFISKAIEFFPATSPAKQHELRDLLPSAAFLLCGIFGILLTRLILTPNNHYSFTDWMLYWIYQKPLPSYILGYFVTFGPLLAILYPAQNVLKTYLKKNRFHLYYLLIVSVLSWVIGSDTDRFLYWAIPIWLVMFGLALESLLPVLKKSVVLCLCLMLTQCLSQRAFLPTPDYAPDQIQYRIPILTVICNEGCNLDIPSYHGRTGAGFSATYCSIKPCDVNGDSLPIKWYQLLEYIFITGIIVLGIIRKQRILSQYGAIT